MQIIRPNAITEAMLLYCSIAEPDSINGETAWSSTEICAIGDERYIGSLSHSVTISTANPAVVTWANHGLAQDTPVVLSTTGTLPTGLTAGTTYFVSSVLSSSTFTLSASVGGRQIRVTAGGSGTHTATAKVHKVFTAIAGQKSTVTMTIASPGVVAYTAHGLSADTPIVFTTTGALPTGLTAGTTYYVKTVSDADHFTVAATVGGSAINTTGSQSGTHTCGLASNYNKPPLQYDDTVWTYLAPTNRWAMFDDQLGTVSSNADTLRVVLQPGRFNALALLETAASTVGVWLEISRATVTFNSTTDKVNYNAHGFAAGTQVVFWKADPTSDTLPTEIEEGTTYYVVNPTTNDFQVSATDGGSAIDLSGAGSGTRTCGELVYSRSVNLVDNSNVGNWYQYFYEPIYQKDTVAVTDIVDAALLDLPAYGEGVLTVQLDRSVRFGAVRRADPRPRDGRRDSSGQTDDRHEVIQPRRPRRVRQRVDYSAFAHKEDDMPDRGRSQPDGCGQCAHGDVSRHRSSVGRGQEHHFACGVRSCHRLQPRSRIGLPFSDESRSRGDELNEHCSSIHSLPVAQRFA
jgi:hypothetical protein